MSSPDIDCKNDLRGLCPWPRCKGLHSCRDVKLGTAFSIRKFRGALSSNVLLAKCNWAILRDAIVVENDAGIRGAMADARSRCQLGPDNC